MRTALALAMWLVALPVHAQEEAQEAPAEDEAIPVEEEDPPPPAQSPPQEPAPEPAPVPNVQPNPPPVRPSNETSPRVGAQPEETSIPQYSRRITAEEEAENEEGGDPYDFLWIEVQGGVSYVDLRAINADNYYPEFVRLTGWGPAGVLGLGFRIEFLSVGLRVSLARYEVGDAATPDAAFDVGTATAEVTLAIPIPIVRPFARVGFGLGWHGDSNFEAPEMSQTSVFGWVFTGAVGADIYLVDWFAIGVCFTVDILNMNRQTIDEPVTDPGDVRFEETGDAVGAQGRGTVGVSFHF
jgi:hypothetical protein